VRGAVGRVASSHVAAANMSIPDRPRARGLASARTIPFVVCAFAIARAARVDASATHARRAMSSTPSSEASVDDAKLRADFALEDSARAVDVIVYEGPAYDGCCPLAGKNEVEGGEEMLACCSSGGCCPSTEPGGGFGKHLACCESKQGSEEHNRARSRVWYSGPSYDGCCPNADGDDLACCGASAGCCPADGGRRHSCCPDLPVVPAVAQGQDEYEYEDAVDDGEEREEWGRSTYDSQGLDGEGESWTKGGRAGLEEYSDVEDTSVDENSSSTMYLQLAACVCVVVWASALAAGTFYASTDGRRDDAQEHLRLI